MAWWFDRPLLKALTRGWDHKTINTYSDRICRHQGSIPAPVLATMQNVDAKATGLLTHVSMMIAGLGLIAPLVADQRLEEGIIIFEMAIYLLIAIGCLRCLNVLNPPSDEDGVETAADLNHELVLRRTLYSVCIHTATIVTVCIVVSLPAMYFW